MIQWLLEGVSASARASCDELGDECDVFDAAPQSLSWVADDRGSIIELLFCVRR